MADVVDEMPDDSRGRKVGSKYDQYFDGRIWKLTRGFDYDQPSSQFCSYLRTVAKRRGIKLHCAIKDNERVVYVQAIRS